MPRLTTPCKTCNSPERGFIEAALRRGDSYAAIEAQLKAKGIAISHTSILRHYAEHVQPDAKSVAHEAVPEISDDSSSSFFMGIDHQGVLERALVPTRHTPILDLAKEQACELQTLVYAALKNQLAVVLASQESLFKGEGRLPKEQVETLRLLHGIYSGLPLSQHIQTPLGEAEERRDVLRRIRTEGFEAGTIARDFLAAPRHPLSEAENARLPWYLPALANVEAMDAWLDGFSEAAGMSHSEWQLTMEYQYGPSNRELWASFAQDDEADDRDN